MIYLRKLGVTHWTSSIDCLIEDVSIEKKNALLISCVNPDVVAHPLFLILVQHCPATDSEALIRAVGQVSATHGELCSGALTDATVVEDLVFMTPSMPNFGSLVSFFTATILALCIIVGAPLDQPDNVSCVSLLCRFCGVKTASWLFDKMSCNSNKKKEEVQDCASWIRDKTSLSKEK